VVFLRFRMLRIRRALLARTSAFSHPAPGASPGQPKIRPDKSTSAAYNERAVRRSWRYTMDFLKEVLGR